MTSSPPRPRPVRPAPPPRDPLAQARRSPIDWALLVAFVLLIAGSLVGACSAQQQRQARQIFEVADQSCAVLKAAGLSDPRLEGVCMTGDEIKIAVEAVLRAREAAAAVAGAGSLPAPRSATPPPSAAPPAPSSAPAAAAASSSPRPVGSAR